MVSNGVRRVRRGMFLSGSSQGTSESTSTSLEWSSAYSSGTADTGDDTTGYWTSSDVVVFDCYDKDGNHWVEYEYSTKIDPVPEPPPELEEIVRKPKKLNPSRKLSSNKARSPGILSPPGGWFFFKG